MSHRSGIVSRAAWLFLACLGAQAQGPVVTPTVVPTFAYTMNSGVFPAAQTVKITLPAAISTLPVSVSNIQAASVVCSGTPPCGWLSVTPDLGNAPLTLSVSVNPTGLTPGNYAGSFLIDTVPSSGKQAVTVTVNLQISNPPSALMISSSTLNFTYTTGSGQSTLAWFEVDVSSTGDLIPFNVTVANAKSGSSGSGSTAVWLRVSSVSPTQGAALTTSGSAGVGSLVPIFVTVDYATLQGLGIGQYNATVTITPATANSKLNVSQTVAVGLVVSAGAPTVSSVFPESVIPALPTDPVFTIYGSNFTANTSVFLDAFVGLPLETNTQITAARLTLVSPKILQAKVPAASLYALPAGYIYPYTCTLRIQNGGFPEVDISFTVTDPSAPSISLIVNAASYQQISKFVGSASDPATTPATNPPTAVSPRGVISLFGQNLGPSVVSTASPNAAVTPSCPTGNCYATTWGTMQIRVGFTFYDPTLTPPGMRTVYAPILMTSINQINVIVPWEVANLLRSNKAPTATVQVWSGVTASQPPYPVTVLPEDPGIFTFGGLGQGQGAIINYDANNAATINSSTNQEPRGNVIAIFATGLGEMDPNIPDGALTLATAAGTPLLDSSNVRVYVGGQPAVVLYAGTSPGAVAGLVQINAIIPPTATTGSAVPITLSIGDPTVARQAQTNVTVAIKAK